MHGQGKRVPLPRREVAPGIGEVLETGMRIMINREDVTAQQD